MSSDDLSAFRAEMQRRGVYDRPQPRFKTRADRVTRTMRRASVSQRAAAEVVRDPASMSIKRLAWAFGCARPDSETEVTLYRALVERIEQARKARTP